MTLLDPKRFREVVVVCGSRGFDNRALFASSLRLVRSLIDDNVLFVSGAASTGADNLIIHYCRAYKLPCLEMPAQWDKYKAAAGMIRNKEMLKIASRVVAFWDGQSKGTAHMVENSRKIGFPLHLINTETRKITHEGKRINSAQVKESVDRLGQFTGHETGQDHLQQPANSLPGVEQPSLLQPGDGRFSGGSSVLPGQANAVENADRAFRFTPL
jgi:hypothetical protein